MTEQAFPPLLIRASAGTGKTFQLTTRIIGLIARGHAPSRILATTFTRKAAGEILSRVFVRLAAAARSEESAALLDQEIGGAGLTKETAGKLLFRLARSQHLLNICTLDSFFVKVARLFAPELGLPVDWRISDSAAEQQLRARAVEGVLEHDEQDVLKTLLQMSNNGRTAPTVYERLLEVVAGAHDIFCVTTPDAWKWLNPPAPLSEEALEKLCEDIRALPLQTTKTGEPVKRWVTARADCLAAVEARRWKEVVDNGFCKCLIEAAKEWVRGTAPRGVKYDKKEIDDATAAAYGRLIDHVTAIYLKLLADRTNATHDILELFEHHYRAAQRERALFQFQDITYLLARQRFTERFYELYFRLDEEIRHLLFDEFQDTAIPQYRVLEPIAEEILTASGSERSFFCVGDTKQAIYGWRGGEAAIFDSLEARYKLNPDVLAESRRSSPVVLELVNELFGSLSANGALDKYRDIAKRWEASFPEHRAHKAGLPGYVALYGESCKGHVASARPRIHRRAVDLAASIHLRQPSATVGVLLRANRHIPGIVSALREMNIPASEEAGVSLLESPAVLLLLSLLKLADHPGDKIARYHIACSQLGRVLGFTDHGDSRAALALSRRLRRQLLNDGYGPTVFAYTELLKPYCNAREQSRLLQLADIAYAFEPQAGTRTTDFVRHVEHAKVEEPGSEVVRVMTIHQAKGLEFDAVILPDLEDNLDKLADPVIAYRERPLAPVIRVIAGGGKCERTDAEIKRIYDAAKAARVWESLNLLYVALTRARHAVYAIVTTREHQNIRATFSGVLLGWFEKLGENRPTEECIYQQGDPEWRLAEAPAGAGLEMPPEPSLKIARTARRRMLPRIAPSALEGGERWVSLAHELEPRSSVAMQRGIALHALFEGVEWLEDLAVNDAALGARIGPLVQPPLTVEKLLAEFQAALACPEIARLLSRAAYPQEEKIQVERELPFAARLEDSLVDGKIDRLHLVWRDEQLARAEIIELKTDRIAADDQALAEAVARYRPQLDAYRRVVCSQFRLAPERVTVHLAFLTPGRVVTLHPG